MKNKTIVILIILVIGMGAIVFGITRVKNNTSHNQLEGYYALEKVIMYFKVDDEEKAVETLKNSFNDKMHITNNKVEKNIAEIYSYYYILKDTTIYYSESKLNEENLENAKNIEYEINGDYLILTKREDATKTYYYKKITKEEY